MQLPDISNPAFQIRFIGLIIGLIVGTTFHEFGHAFTALMLGDDTAQRAGRVTLNPVAHFDPLGFVLMIMLAANVFGFAWGKPTPVNPSRLQGGRKGNSLVALGGPFANIIVATAFAIPLRFAPIPPDNIYPDNIHEILAWAVSANILLFSFNLIPIPPLDGFGLVSGIVSNTWYRLIAPLYRNGIVLLLIIGFGIPYITNILFHDSISIVGRIIGPVEALLQNLIVGHQIGLSVKGEDIGKQAALSRPPALSCAGRIGQSRSRERGGCCNSGPLPQPAATRPFQRHACPRPPS